VIRLVFETGEKPEGNYVMAWTKPTLVEVCIGMEVTGYESAE